MKFFILLLLFVSLIISFIPSNNADIVKGTKPSDMNYIFYKDKSLKDLQNQKFACLSDSRKIFSADKINDDYCDCEDGSDEPGTSACSNGVFHCINWYAASKDITSSRVNDGICDCCDGSDEPAGKCENTCKQHGAKQLQEVNDKIDAIQNGLKLKQQHINEGKTEIEKLRKEKQEISDALLLQKALLESLKAEKEKVEKLEEFERKVLESKLEKEDESKIDAAVREILENQNKEEKPIQEEDNQDPIPSTDENQEIETKPEKKVETADEAKQRLEKEMEEERKKKAQEHKTKEADLAREKYNAKNTEVETLNKRLVEIDRTLGLDFGPEKEFYYLKKDNKCWTYDTREYTYELCAYEKANQKEKRGGSSLLGVWGNFEENYTVMKFENGNNCWNGPKRSVKVILQCGALQEIKSVEEPSRCAYQMVLSLPEACKESDLQKLNEEKKRLI